jgi:hypothetical protein
MKKLIFMNWIQSNSMLMNLANGAGSLESIKIKLWGTLLTILTI